MALKILLFIPFSKSLTDLCTQLTLGTIKNPLERLERGPRTIGSVRSLDKVTNYLTHVYARFQLSRRSIQTYGKRNNTKWKKKRKDIPEAVCIEPIDLSHRVRLFANICNVKKL